LRVSVDEIDHVVKPPADAGADAASGDGDGKMGFAGAGPADQHGIALLGDEAAAGEVEYPGDPTAWLRDLDSNLD
jgi:hypothetical protein